MGTVSVPTVVEELEQPEQPLEVEPVAVFLPSLTQEDVDEALLQVIEDYSASAVSLPCIMSLMPWLSSASRTARTFSASRLMRSRFVIITVSIS